jgi:hypothetical protein
MVGAMSTTIVFVSDQTTRLLDAKPMPDEFVSAEDAKDSTKLARLLTRMLAQLAATRRRFVPKRTTFQNIVSTGTDASPMRVNLLHKFDAPVEWWVVGTNSLGTVALPLVAEAEDDSDADTLAIDIYFAGTLAIRVEESG